MWGTQISFVNYSDFRFQFSTSKNNILSEPPSGLARWPIIPSHWVYPFTQGRRAAHFLCQPVRQRISSGTLAAGTLRHRNTALVFLSVNLRHSTSCKQIKKNMDKLWFFSLQVNNAGGAQRHLLVSTNLTFNPETGSQQDEDSCWRRARYVIHACLKWRCLSRELYPPLVRF